MPFYEVAGRGEKSGRSRKPRHYFAKSEVAASRQARQDGFKVETIKLLSVWGCVTTLAGCSHRNADNTSRQKILEKCQADELFILEHELNNRYDKHAIRVLRADRDQLGYLPKDVAHNIIEGYWADSGCGYWALNLGTERMSDDTELLTARILVLVALPSAEDNRDGVKRELNRLGFHELTPESVRWQPLRTVQQDIRKQTSGAEQQRSGCLGVILFAVSVVVPVLAVLLR